MSPTQQLSVFVFALLASTALTAAALAQEPSGTAVKVSPNASASGVTGARTLQAPGDIFQGDEIETNPGGQAQIRFVDDTRFVVGPNSRVVIDRFVFNPDQTARNVAFNAAKGTFRFISGRSASEAYTVNTPTMTIGVRGSAYNGVVLVNGRTLVQWLEDRGYVCVVPEGAGGGARDECRDVAAGDLVGASPGGGFDSFRPGEGRSATQLFRDLNSQTGLAPGFQAQVPPGGVGSPDTSENESSEERGAPPPPPPIQEPPPPSYP